MYHKFKQYPNSLRKHRRAIGLTQRDVSKMLGLNTAERLSRWENGSAKPQLKNLFLLAQIYHLSPQELFSEMWAVTGKATSLPAPQA
jgi:transcriptional regulator with XRE-family HTH domain